MKKLILLMSIAAISCNQTKETPNMQGAYSMLSLSINDGVKDSVITGVKQLKIYTGDQVMYAHFTGDSSSAFGIGSYSAEAGGIKENMIYSATDSVFNSAGTSFNLAIEKTPMGYKQVIDGVEAQGKKYKLTEEYESVSAAKTSPLDGTWKKLKGYTVTGSDTVVLEGTQFKTYYAGHVTWGITYVDSTKQKHTGIGYGSFDMTGDSKVKETCEVTSAYSIRGAVFDIDIEFKGPDGFKQTITDSKGKKFIEEYQRLTK